MDRAKKAEVIDSLRALFSESGLVIATRYTGLTVAEMTSLRARMREAGASYKVAKNRLAKIALEGTPCAPLADLLTGPTALGYGNDPVPAAKALVAYAKTNDKLVILGGIMGRTVLDPEGVQALATLPSLDELRAKIIGMLNTPATRIASVLKQPGAGIARVLAAHAEKSKAA